MDSVPVIKTKLGFLLLLVIVLEVAYPVSAFLYALADPGQKIVRQIWGIWSALVVGALGVLAIVIYIQGRMLIRIVESQQEQATTHEGAETQ